MVYRLNLQQFQVDPKTKQNSVYVVDGLMLSYIINCIGW